MSPLKYPTVTSGNSAGKMVGLYDTNDRNTRFPDGSTRRIIPPVGSYYSILANPLSGSAPSYATSQDDYSDNLILALPFVQNGRDSGLGDYSGDINGGTNRTVSVVDSTTIDTTNSKFYGSCFNTSQQVTIDMTGYGELDGAFCVEYWVRHVAFGSFNFFLGNASTSSGRGQGWKFGSGSTSAYFSYAPNDTDFNTTICSTGDNITQNLNTWYHHCWTRDAGGTVRFFHDGTLITQSVATQSDTIPAASALKINNPVYAYTGQMQDFRVYKGTSKYDLTGFSV